jgi:mRNA interferase MazF
MNDDIQLVPVFNELINTVNIIPLTSRKPGRQIYPNEVCVEGNTYGLRDESILLCHQIRTIDKKRFAQFYGQINDVLVQNKIVQSLLFQFGIENIYTE